jgi:hypothetical protein
MPRRDKGPEIGYACTGTASLESSSAEPQPFGGGYPVFFPTAYQSLGERQKTRDLLAVLAGCSERVSAGPHSLISGKIQGISANAVEWRTLEDSIPKVLPVIP